MELFSAAGLLAIAKIIVIDILLAGDNAIVIGMAAKNLQEKHRKLAIFVGHIRGDCFTLNYGVSFCGSD